jgi:hypothetical protein
MTFADSFNSAHPNTRETIRDEAVKYFADAGMLIRNPDNPARPTNSGKTGLPSRATYTRTISFFR